MLPITIVLVFIFFSVLKLFDFILVEHPSPNFFTVLRPTGSLPFYPCCVAGGNATFLFAADRSRSFASTVDGLGGGVSGHRVVCNPT